MAHSNVTGDVGVRGPGVFAVQTVSLSGSFTAPPMRPSPNARNSRQHLKAEKRERCWGSLDRQSRGTSPTDRSSNAAPLSAIEPFRDGVSTAIRGDARIAASRVAGLVVVGVCAGRGCRRGACLSRRSGLRRRFLSSSFAGLTGLVGFHLRRRKEIAPTQQHRHREDDRDQHIDLAVGRWLFIVASVGDGRKSKSAAI